MSMLVVYHCPALLTVVIKIDNLCENVLPNIFTTKLWISAEIQVKEVKKVSLVPNKKPFDLRAAYEQIFGEGNVSFYESLNGFAIGDKVSFTPIPGVSSITSGKVELILEATVPSPQTFLIVINGDRRVRVPVQNVTT